MAGPLRVTLSERLLSEHATLSDHDPHLHSSSSLTQAHKHIKALETENKALKEELADLRLAHKQLLTEGSHENFDERRVNWLKAHIIQLERQLILLQEALGVRAELLVEVENALSAISNCCRKYSVGESRVGTVSVPRADLLDVIESAESSKIKLYRNIEKSEIKWRKLFGVERFSSGEVTLLDVLSSKTEHLNLHQVAHLESQLAKLYKQLLLLNKSLHVICMKPVQSDVESFKKVNKSSTKPHAPAAVYERILGQVARSCNMLEETSSKLLELTVLVPSAPWPALRRHAVKEITTDHVMDKLSSVPRSKARETREVVDSLVKAINYTLHMAKAESGHARQEADFHQEIYSVQHQYVQELIKAIRSGYVSFEREVNEVLCKPLREIMTVFETLRVTASEDSLRLFLAAFKQHAEQIDEALQKLETNHSTSEDCRESLSQYGEAYMSAVDSLCSQHQQKRDDTISELDLIKKLRASHLDQLTKLFTPCKPEEIVETSAAGKEHESQVLKTEERSQTVRRETDGEDSRKALNTAQRKHETTRHQPRHKVGQELQDEDTECTCGADDRAISVPHQNSSPIQLTPVEVESHPRPKSAVRHSSQRERSRRSPNSRPPPGVAQSKLTLISRSRGSESVERRGRDGQSSRSTSGLRRTNSSSSLSDDINNTPSPQNKTSAYSQSKPWK